MTQQPPIPPGHWLWGNMQDFNRDTLGFLETMTTYGDLVRFRFGPFAGYFVNHPDTVHEMLVSKAKSFVKPAMLKNALADVSGENIFTGDGDFWKHQRKLMQPAFHSKVIGNYADTMVDFTQRAITDWQNGAEIDVDVAVTALTMNIITKTMFDTEVGDETREIGQAFTRLFELVNARMERLFLLPSWIPTPENREAQRMTERIKAVTRRFIAARRASGEQKGDLLSMLLAARDDEGQPMPDEQIINEAITIFGAGHETTAYTMTFAWYALSQNPQVVEKLHQEVDAVLGGRPATLEDLPHLPYTEMVIKETLRLYPPAWGFSRGVIEDVEIGGYTIPKGSAVMVAPWTLGRDSRWFPNPDSFEPERFSAENEPNIPRYAFIPFGGGPRICIGNQFAMMEARLILATVAQHYTLELKPSFTTQPHRAFTLRPSNGMKMIARVREAVPVV